MSAVVPPKGWVESTLGNLAKIERTTVQPEEIQTGTTYLGLEHITSEGQFTEVKSVEAGELASNKFAFNDKHLLYGKLRPYLKKIARPQFAGVCSTDILPILPGPKVDRNFLYYYLRQPSYIELATTRATGANLPRLSPKELAEFSIFIPPLEEQRRIAAILDKADAVRRKRQEAIALTEELLRSAFLEMFGDPDTNPKGWEVVSLGDHLSFVTSGSRGWAQYYSNTGDRFIRSLDVRMNHISDVEAVFVNVPNNAEAKRTRVEEGDVLLTITGSRIGRVAPVPKGFGTAYISQHVAILRPKPTISPQYLSFFLSVPSGGQRQIASMQYGQTKPGLNLSQVSSFQVPLPPMEKQRRFDSFWSRHHSALNNQITALARDSSLFNSLLQRAFCGKL